MWHFYLTVSFCLTNMMVCFFYKYSKTSSVFPSVTFCPLIFKAFFWILNFFAFFFGSFRYKDVCPGTCLLDHMATVAFLGTSILFPIVTAPTSFGITFVNRSLGNIFLADHFCFVIQQGSRDCDNAYSYSELTLVLWSPTALLGGWGICNSILARSERLLPALEPKVCCFEDCSSLLS